MALNKETARLAGQKSRRGPAKRLEPNIKEKMELLYEEVLDHLIMRQDELSNSDRVKLVQTLSNYIVPKTKSVSDQFTKAEKAEEQKNSPFNWE